MHIDLDALQQVISSVFTFNVLFYLLLGTLIGLVFGVLPGLNAALATAVMLPVTLLLPLNCAIALLIGCYKAGIYGGSVTGILFRTPGSPPNVMTALDGYELTKKGLGGKALRMALYSSFTADILSDFLFIFLALPIGHFAPKMGPAQLTALFALSLTLLLIFASDDIFRGLIAIGLGLCLASVGTDPMLGTLRLTFGIKGLYTGMDIMPIVLGLFAVPEIISQVIDIVFRKETSFVLAEDIKSILKKGTLKFTEFIRYWKAVLVGLIIGTAVGALPGPGATMAAFTSYGVMKKISKHPEEYGKGSLEAIAAAEAGNNATVGPTFIPLITFGIPGSMIAGLFGAAFQMQGIQMGPRTIVEHPATIYMFFILLIIGNFYYLLLGRGLMPVFAKLGSIPRHILWPLLSLLIVIGAYIAEFRVTDVGVLIFAGLIGYLARILFIPLSPMILTILIAPLLERSFRQSLILSQGDLTFFFKDGISLILWLLTMIALIVNIRGMKKKELSIKDE